MGGLILEVGKYYVTAGGWTALCSNIFGSLGGEIAVVVHWPDTGKFSIHAHNGVGRFLDLFGYAKEDHPAHLLTEDKRQNDFVREKYPDRSVPKHYRNLPINFCSKCESREN